MVADVQELVDSQRKEILSRRGDSSYFENYHPPEEVFAYFESLVSRLHVIESFFTHGNRRLNFPSLQPLPQLEQLPTEKICVLFTYPRTVLRERRPCGSMEASMLGKYRVYYSALNH